MDDSEETKSISLLKDNNFEANQIPRIQVSKHLIFEADLLPHFEIKCCKELKWQ